MQDKLEKLLISRLNLIRKIQEFVPDIQSDEAQEIINLLKQFVDYDFSAQTKTKNRGKVHQKMVLTLVYIDQL